MYATKNRKLIGVYRQVEDCPFCRREGNNFRHILGVGDTQKPKSALILINPTRLNISSKPTWESYRFPFIGVRRFWKVLGRAGIISSDLLGEIYGNDWPPAVLEKVKKELTSRRVYLTNLVKCTKNGPEYPSKEQIVFGKAQLLKELRILRPEYIICFGLLTFRELTGRSVGLGEIYRNLKSGQLDPFSPQSELRLNAKVLPCYFPAGRGNPTRASEMLKYYLGGL